VKERFFLYFFSNWENFNCKSWLKNSFYEYFKFFVFHYSLDKVLVYLQSFLWILWNYSYFKKSFFEYCFLYFFYLDLIERKVLIAFDLFYCKIIQFSLIKKYFLFLFFDYFKGKNYNFGHRVVNNFNWNWINYYYICIKFNLFPGHHFRVF
jgi:hypothetical protein